MPSEKSTEVPGSHAIQQVLQDATVSEYTQEHGVVSLRNFEKHQFHWQDNVTTMDPNLIPRKQREEARWGLRFFFFAAGFGAEAERLAREIESDRWGWAPVVWLLAKIFALDER